MSTSGISNNTIEQIIQNTSENASKRNTNGELGKNDFLNLLVTQLRYQDPLNPTDDKEFIAQMAQFSSLEQMQNMSSTLTNSQAFSMIGKRVTATITDSSNSELKTVVGEVSTVKVSNGKTYVVINGQDIEADKVTQVDKSIYSNNSNLSAYTNLIGYRVKGATYDSSSGDVVYVSGDVSEIQKGLYEDYAVMDNVSVTISEINNGVTSTDANYIENYLKDNEGKSVSLIIKDEASGMRAPITGTLDSYKIENGKVTAVISKALIPVDSVSNIKQKPE